MLSLRPRSESIFERPFPIECEAKELPSGTFAMDMGFIRDHCATTKSRTGNSQRHMETAHASIGLIPTMLGVSAYLARSDAEFWLCDVKELMPSGSASLLGCRIEH